MPSPHLRVYLAGPITGESWGGATDWRTRVDNELEEISNGKVRGYSPLRGKGYLSDESEIKDCYNDTVLSSQAGITYRDRHDVMTADLVFVNMLGAKRVSIGTVLEMAWADSKKTPIVLVMEKEGNLHDHSMVREIAPLRVETLEDGILMVRRILLP